MLQLEKKLNNQTGQSFSYATEQLARVKIDVSEDGTVTISLIDDSDKNENFLLIASQSSGLEIK